MLKLFEIKITQFIKYIKDIDYIKTISSIMATLLFSVRSLRLEIFRWNIDSIVLISPNYNIYTLNYIMEKSKRHFNFIIHFTLAEKKSVWQVFCVKISIVFLYNYNQIFLDLIILIAVHLLTIGNTLHLAIYNKFRLWQRQNIQRIRIYTYNANTMKIISNAWFQRKK